MTGNEQQSIQLIYRHQRKPLQVPKLRKVRKVVVRHPLQAHEQGSQLRHIQKTSVRSHSIQRSKGETQLHHNMTDQNKSKPRIFYSEEANDAWVPVPESTEDLINEDYFMDEGEEIELKFRRADMTDEEFDNLPDGD